MPLSVQPDRQRRSWLTSIPPLIALTFAIGGASANQRRLEPELQSIEEIEVLYDEAERLGHWSWSNETVRSDTIRSILTSDAASVFSQSPEFSLLVIEQEDRSIVLDVEAQYFQDVGDYVISGVLTENSGEISEAMTNVVLASTEFRDVRIDGEALAASAAVLDSSAWALMSEIESDSWRTRWHNERSLDIPEDVIKRYLLGQVHRFLNAAEAADEARYNKERIIPLHTIDSIRAATHMVVAISQVKPSGKSVHIGTGFVYKGHIVTAAHVLTKDEFWPNGFGPDLTHDLSSLRVIHVSENADRFDADAVLPIRPNVVKLWPELDVAAIQIGETENPRTRLALTDAENVPVSFEPSEADCKIGSVFGLTSVEPGSKEPAPMWIPPGRIVFPSEVFRPSHALQMDGGDYYFRAVRAEVFGTGALSCTDTQLAQVAYRVWKRYSVCRNEIQCRLAGDYGRSRGKLSAIAGRPLDFVPCFGTDLVTEPAASGSPIFRLDGESQVLIGIHLGVAGPTGGVPTRTSLANYGRVAPFTLAKEMIDVWIANQSE